ncbi:hypothetical protein P171DRAFT_188173 [Karstenula rhodostoma CBS 690.94]|uniref:Uncharacterized protein n=1 Tax=Karstenula rhodostoma CBS 690.94 TaxID=1392251 RepID=A0A9P4PUM7_9PLEO|nr:hypothetical protein P171DRAFT_188173 [Karstenula rhodostoma CBS 690.94]
MTWSRPMAIWGMSSFWHPSEIPASLYSPDLVLACQLLHTYVPVLSEPSTLLLHVQRCCLLHLHLHTVLSALSADTSSVLFVLLRWFLSYPIIHSPLLRICFVPTPYAVSIRRLSSPLSSSSYSLVEHLPRPLQTSSRWYPSPHAPQPSIFRVPQSVDEPSSDRVFQFPRHSHGTS